LGVSFYKKGLGGNMAIPDLSKMSRAHGPINKAKAKQLYQRILKEEQDIADGIRNWTGELAQSHIDMRHEAGDVCPHEFVRRDEGCDAEGVRAFFCEDCGLQIFEQIS
jgi:hypothetical protein